MTAIGSVLRHRLEVRALIVSAALAADGEDRGHPTRTGTLLGTFAGLVQPRSARERASASGRDVSIGSHRIYLEAGALALPVDTDMHVVKIGTVDPDLNGTYRVLAAGNAAGQGHHVEIDAERTEP